MPQRALFSAGLLAATCAAYPHAAELTVTVDNLASAKGTLRVAVYDEASWLDDEPPWGEARPVPAETESLQFSFDLPPGTYAIAVLHDENDNGKMDYRLLRLPKEPYGFSNDVVPRLGPPKFEAAAFSVGEEAVALDITLRD